MEEAWKVCGEAAIGVFMEELASKAPTPGGGGAAALAGAAGAALAQMVGNLTAGKKKYAVYEEDIQRILREAERLRQELLLLVDEDAKAFEPLSRAYGLPKDTPEQAAHKETVMEEALLSASEVPLRIMETAAEAIRLHEELAVKGSTLAVSDVGVGAKLLEAAVESASLNVFINTKLMKDREKAAELNARADTLSRESVEAAARIFCEVKDKLLPH